MAARRYATRGFQEGQEAKFQQRWYGQVLPALLRRAPGSHERDHYTSANHEVLQGVKDPRGPVGMHARRKPGLRCRQPPSGVWPSKCSYYSDEPSEGRIDRNLEISASFSYLGSNC
jgi:hypothetical protein